MVKFGTNGRGQVNCHLASYEHFNHDLLVMLGLPLEEISN